MASQKNHALFRRSSFTTVPNQVLNDKALSWKARGMFAYLCSKATLEGWRFSKKMLVGQSEPDGEASYDSGLKELKTRGYLVIKKRRRADGKYDYDWILIDQPDPENRGLVKGSPEGDYPDLENRPLKYNKTEGNNTELLDTKNVSSCEDPKFYNSSRWYNEVFKDLTVEYLGHEPLYVPRCYGQAGKIFKEIKSLVKNDPEIDWRKCLETVFDMLPNSDDGLIYYIAAGMAFTFFSDANFSWVKVPDIGNFLVNVQRVYSVYRQWVSADPAMRAENERDKQQVRRLEALEARLNREIDEAELRRTKAPRALPKGKRLPAQNRR